MNPVHLLLENSSGELRAAERRFCEMILADPECVALITAAVTEHAARKRFVDAVAAGLQPQLFPGGDGRSRARINDSVLERIFDAAQQRQALASARAAPAAARAATHLAAARHKVMLLLRDTQEMKLMRSNSSGKTPASEAQITAAHPVVRWLSATDASGHQNHDLFVEALRKHCRGTGKVGSFWEQSAATPLVAVGTAQGHHPWQLLFRRDPEADAPGRNFAQGDNIEIDYAKYSSGRDALGYWHFEPLGQLVDNVVYSDNQAAGGSSGEPDGGGVALLSSNGAWSVSWRCVDTAQHRGRGATSAVVAAAAGEVPQANDMGSGLMGPRGVSVDHHDVYQQQQQEQQRSSAAPDAAESVLLDERVAMHHFKLFVAHYCTKTGAKFVAPLARLDPGVITKALASMHHLITTDRMREQLSSILLRCADPSFSSAADEAPRGLIFYGPPGTAKTLLSAQLTKNTGMVATRVMPQFKYVDDVGTGQPRCVYLGAVSHGSGYAAGEMRHGLQGACEKNIKALFSRATSVPWLPVSIVIDEIESLVADRAATANGSGGGSSDASALGTLLAYFQGLNDQGAKNTFVIAATNYIDKIDAAFLRRVSKVFVGVPPTTIRFDWNLLSRPGDTRPVLGIDDTLRAQMARLTLGFSGAEMGKLFSELKHRCLSGAAPAQSSDLAAAAQKSEGAPRLLVTNDVLLAAIAHVIETEKIAGAGAMTVMDYDKALDAEGNADAVRADFGCIASVVQQRRKAGDAAAAPSGRIFVWAPKRQAATSSRGSVAADIWSSDEDEGGGVGVTAAAERQPSRRQTQHAYDGPTIDVVLASDAVHTFRCQRANGVVLPGSDDAAAALSGAAPDVWPGKGVLIGAGLVEMALTLDATCVKVVDSAFFMRRGAVAELDKCKTLAVLVAEAREYDKTMLVLDLDCCLVCGQMEHRLLADMLSVANNYAFLSVAPSTGQQSEPASLSFLFCAVVTSSPEIRRVAGCWPVSGVHAKLCRSLSELQRLRAQLPKSCSLEQDGGEEQAGLQPLRKAVNSALLQRHGGDAGKHRTVRLFSSSSSSSINTFAVWCNHCSVPLIPGLPSAAPSARADEPEDCPCFQCRQKLQRTAARRFVVTLLRERGVVAAQAVHLWFEEAALVASPERPAVHAASFSGRSSPMLGAGGVDDDDSAAGAAAEVLLLGQGTSSPARRVQTAACGATTQQLSKCDADRAAWLEMELQLRMQRSRSKSNPVADKISSFAPWCSTEDALWRFGTDLVGGDLPPLVKDSDGSMFRRFQLGCGTKKTTFLRRYYAPGGYSTSRQRCGEACAAGDAPQHFLHCLHSQPAKTWMQEEQKQRAADGAAAVNIGASLGLCAQDKM